MRRSAPTTALHLLVPRSSTEEPFDLEVAGAVGLEDLTFVLEPSQLLYPFEADSAATAVVAQTVAENFGTEPLIAASGKLLEDLNVESDV